MICGTIIESISEFLIQINVTEVNFPTRDFPSSISDLMVRLTMTDGYVKRVVS